MSSNIKFIFAFFCLFSFASATLAQRMPWQPPMTDEWSSGAAPRLPTEAKFVYMSATKYEPSVADVVGPTGWVSVSMGYSNVSLDNARQHACNQPLGMFYNWRHNGDSRHTAVWAELLDQCLTKGLVCKTGFLAGKESQWRQGDGRAVGLACGKKTQAEADKAAAESCEKARTARGLPGPCRELSGG